MTICLIVVFYAGNRDGNQQHLYKNYMDAHLKMLSEVKNNLDSIYFVINTDNLLEETIEIDEHNPKIKRYFRNNKNLSLGGWVDVMDKTDYDHYILCEDDYLFIKDNFDTILIDEYTKYNSEYHILWRGLYGDNIDNNAIQHIKNNKGFQQELICTIGILSKKNKNKCIDKNFNNTNMNKQVSMCKFLQSFNSVSYSRNNVFPYYNYINDSIQLYINDNNENVIYVNSKTTPLKYNDLNNIITGKSLNHTNINSPILACYQYVISLRGDNKVKNELKNNKVKNELNNKKIKRIQKIKKKYRK